MCTYACWAQAKAACLLSGQQDYATCDDRLRHAHKLLYCKHKSIAGSWFSSGPDKIRSACVESRLSFAAATTTHKWHHIDQANRAPLIKTVVARTRRGKFRPLALVQPAGGPSAGARERERESHLV